MREYPITVILMVANVIFSYFGFQRAGWMEKYMFWVEKILIRKEYYRVISSGFLHVSLTHIVMNLLTLYYLGSVLEQIFAHKYGPIGSLIYVLIYFGSMLGGDILSLMMHRNHPDYTAVGASGAISGVVFALVLLMPYQYILLFLIIPMPFWLYGVLFVLFSLFGIRTGIGNIGHDAHLGGALVGLLICGIFFPSIAIEHWLLFTSLVLPTLLLIYLFYHNPSLGVNPMAVLKNINWGFSKKRKKPTTRVDSRNQPTEKRVKQDGLEINMKAKLQAEMDALLDKVAKKGIHGLTMTERARLDELAAYLGKSDNLRGGRAPRD